MVWSVTRVIRASTQASWHCRRTGSPTVSRTPSPLQAVSPTENIGSLGKLKEAVTLKRGILTEIPYIGGRDFYPDLGEVGKDVIEGEGTLGFEASLAGMTS